MVQRYYELKYN